MRISAMVVALSLTFAGTAAAEDATSTGSRVRSTDPAVAALIARAIEQSATFRNLVAVIDASDGIVYVEDGPCGHGVRACLIAVTAAGGQRVLRIRVRARGAEAALMATIGHELRHAIEVLRNPHVTSTAAMQQFYLRHGSRRTGGAIETSEAIEAGAAVSADLRGR